MYIQVFSLFLALFPLDFEEPFPFLIFCPTTTYSMSVDRMNIGHDARGHFIPNFRSHKDFMCVHRCLLHVLWLDVLFFMEHVDKFYIRILHLESKNANFLLKDE